MPPLILLAGCGLGKKSELKRSWGIVFKDFFSPSADPWGKLK